ncbi:MFS transporter [Nocardia sp. XZ_19_231]|uniref:MFS transporter n=1 Tax=Nocardia sp. XZ_19_231 TaxID=2769252 RepID=UPI0018909E99|nr:MFS transporter [Nocardia sp. XZ_19_231]
MDVVTQPGGSPGVSGGWTPRLILSMASIMLLLELLAVSYIMISMVIPEISGHYQTTQGAWMLTAFLLVGAVTGPLLGKLADMYGKRKFLLLCVGIAAAGGLISAVSTSYSVMIIGRSLSGFLIPCVFLSYSLIRDVFPAKTIALAVSIVTSGMGLIAIPAPFFAGWIIDNMGFRGVFWLFTAGMVIFGPAIYLTTQESTVRLHARIDLVGAVLLGAGVAGVLVGISFGPSWGWQAGSTLLFILGGIVLLGAWLVTAGKLRDPLVDLSILRKRPVYITAVASGMCYGGSALYTILLPMMAMTPSEMGLGYGFGVSAKGFAIFQAPIGGMVAVGGIIVGLLVGRRDIRPRWLMIVGMSFMAAAFLLTALVHDNKPLLLLFGALIGTGMGLGYAAVPNLLIEAVPPQLQASTASIVNVAQSVVAAALPVVVFSTLHSYIAPIPMEMTHGHIFYTDEGFKVAFLIGAGCAAFAAIIALFVPKKIEQVELPKETVSASGPVSSTGGPEPVAVA